MFLTWRERLEQRPSLRSFNNWPLISIQEIGKDKRKQFILHQQIIALVLSGKTAKEISGTHRISTSKISKLLNRCLGGDAEADPPLTAALIPNRHLNSAVRREALPTVTQPSGSRCAFTALLDRVPGLRGHLDKHLLADLNDHAWGHNVTPESFHAAFRAYLPTLGWPRDTYPYTEPLEGYEACRLYFHHRRDQLILEDNEKKESPPRTVDRKISAPRCFENVQLDEHCYDSPSTIHIGIDGRVTPVRIARITLIVAVDVATMLVLAYVLVLRKAANRHDVLRCLAAIYQAWTPKKLSSGFEYAPGAGFPAGILFDDDTAPAIGEISLDNALAHHSNDVRDFVVSQDYLGATLTIGIARLPKARNWIEYVFKRLTRTSHSLKSTSGTGPSDPRRESSKNAKKPPVITLAALEDCIETSLANENAKTRSMLRQETPLVDFETLLSTTYVPRLPRNNIDNIRKIYNTNRVKIHQDKNGIRHINFCFKKYTGKALYGATIGETHVYVQHDEDIRSVQVYTADGKHLGAVKAPKSWQSYPHSMLTRKIIHDLTKGARMKIQDYPIWYYNFLLESKGKEGVALELVRINREFTATGIEFRPAISEPSTDTPETKDIHVDEDGTNEFSDWFSEYYNGEDL